MPINVARKHPQGIPFTTIALVICSQCGEHEMEMIHKTYRAFIHPSDEPIYDIGHICWNCF